MASITLQNEAGNWKYTTTVDDPLFRPILGAMFEEGMTLPSELTIQGSLGEALEREWKYIDVLRKWMEWEQKVNSASIHPIVHLTTARLTKSQEQVINVGCVPPPTLWRHDLLVLSTALNLPEGWEAYTAIDERTSLMDRVHHMQASLTFLQHDINNVKRGLQDAEDDQGAYDLIIDSHIYSMPNKIVHLLAPFTRNLWLINRGSEVDPDTKKLWDHITLHTYLDRLDWEGISMYLAPYAEEGTISRVFRLANTMTGRDSGRNTDYCVMLGRARMSIGFVGDEYTIDTNCLSRIYTRLLAHLPEDTSIERMGLEPILDMRVSVWDVTHQGYFDTYVGDVVAWVHASVLKYPQWYKNGPPKKLGNKRHYIASNDTHTLSLENFPDIVSFLGKTLGLYAMRRILLCLLYYIQAEQEKGVTTELVRIRVNRANRFAKLLEEYLASHDGDEGVRTLQLAKVVKELNL